MTIINATIAQLITDLQQERRSGSTRPEPIIVVNEDMQAAFTTIDALLMPAASGAANLVLATPNGAPGAVALRALTAADLPASTSVTAAGNLTASALTVGDDGVRGIKTLANVAAGQVLASGTPPAWTATPTLTSVTFGSGTPLSVYQEGTWTPTDGSGASLSLTIVYAIYTKIGRQIILGGKITWPATANGNVAQIAGAPFNATQTTFGPAGLVHASDMGILGFTAASSTIGFFTNAGLVFTNAQMSTLSVSFTGTPYY